MTLRTSRRSNLQAAGNLLDRFVGQAAQLVLHVKQKGDKNRALDRVMRKHVRKARFQFVRKFHRSEFPSPASVELFPRPTRGRHFYRSTSPSTISMLPIAATTSAISCPWHIGRIAFRLAKDGLRMCTRYGFAVPSLTM